MTNQEAIKQLVNLRTHCRTMGNNEKLERYSDLWYDDCRAIDMAISALRERDAREEAESEHEKGNEP